MQPMANMEAIMPNPTRKDLRSRMAALKEEIATLNGRIAALKDERRNLAATLRNNAGGSAEKPAQNKAGPGGKGAGKGAGKAKAAKAATAAED